MEQDYDYLFKIIIIGDSGIGKSAILFRFANDTYNNSYISTMGIDFKIKTIFVDGKIIKLQIWDTAGQERFRTITTSYYRGAHIIFMCYDITDRESFQNLKMWYEEVKKYASPNVSIVVIGTKMDLKSRRKVSHEEGKLYANTHGFDFYETSSKENINVDELFEKSSKAVLGNFMTELKNNAENSITEKKKKILSSQNTISISTTGFKNTIYKKCCV
jgi:Ras-related protein Rab-1A